MMITKMIAGGLTRDEAREAAGLKEKKLHARPLGEKPLPTVEPWRCPCGRLVRISLCLECVADRTKEHTLETTRIALERQRLGIG